MNEGGGWGRDRGKLGSGNIKKDALVRLNIGIYELWPEIWI